MGLFLVLLPILALVGGLFLIGYLYVQRRKAVKALLPRDADQLAFFLSQKISYYRRLQPEDAKRFEERVHAFLHFATFSTREGLELQPEMSWMAATSCVQLTMGLDTFLPDDFDTVIFYPAEYYSRLKKQRHKGEVSLSGAIVMSWKSLQEGMANDHDKINLGLHEMAHALRFTGVRGGSRDAFFDVCFDRWMIVAERERTRLASSETSFFRAYGAVNIDEFFAVCVEHFFEAAKEFRNTSPELYRATCVLLNQDMATDGPLRFDVREHLLEETRSSWAPAATEVPLKRSRMTNGLRKWLGNVVLAGAAVVLFILWPLLTGVFHVPERAATACLFGWILLVIGFFLLNAQRVYFYEKGIVIRYIFGNRKLIIPYASIARFEASWHDPETSNNRSNPYYRTLFLVPGKTISKEGRLTFQPDNSLLRWLIDWMKEKGVPVKIDGGPLKPNKFMR